MTFFALVHGGAHGGWCWEVVVPRLETLGHQCSAPDLPFEQPVGAAGWAATVIASIPTDADDVIVVGHSLAGLALPVIAASRPVRRLVFLGAMVPVPDRPYLDVMADEPEMLAVDNVDRALRGEPTPELTADDAAAPMAWSFVRQAFYQDLPDEVARSAWRRLRTQGFEVFSETCPIASWPDVASTYVVMTDDHAVNPEWSRQVAIGRLGSDLIELPGGHSPFYGRPDELVEVLDGISRR